MGKSRRQDTDGERNLLKKLKEIVRSQEKELAKLKRELARRDDVAGEYRDLLRETEEKAPRTKTQDATCPQCGSPVEMVEVGKFMLFLCTNCKWRIRK